MAEEYDELNTGEAREPLTPEERRRIEEEEERREAERAALLAAQRAALIERQEDAYVLRRVEAEFAERARIQREQHEAELRASGGAGESNLALILLVGILISAAVLILAAVSRPREPQSPTSSHVRPGAIAADAWVDVRMVEFSNRGATRGRSGTSWARGDNPGSGSVPLRVLAARPACHRGRVAST